ncbi:MAG TPA: hypothetical protein VFY39_08010 [Gammaproteobacteria bacterium]|nr:hypothetical protein [Gammaproteobacteria bacterium]
MSTHSRRPAAARHAFVPAILLAVAGLAGGPARGAMHATDEFVAGATRPVKIALLPAQVELRKQKVVRREAKAEEAGELESYLAAAVAKELEHRGYQVRNLASQAQHEDPELLAQAVDASQHYGALLTQIAFKLPRQIEKRSFKADDEMKGLAARLGVDAIAFVQMQMTAEGKGARVLNFTRNGGTETMMSVSVIDGRTSDIEAYFVLPILKRSKALGGYDAIMKDPSGEMARYAGLTLEDLPQASPNPAAAH